MRLYNGCPDAELAAVWADRAAARAEARRLGYVITWFPAEEKYAAARLSDWASVGPFCDNIAECLGHIHNHAAKV